MFVIKKGLNLFMNKYCYIKNCKQNNLHITRGHICKLCKKFGHSDNECNNLQGNACSLVGVPKGRVRAREGQSPSCSYDREKALLFPWVVQENACPLVGVPKGRVQKIIKNLSHINDELPKNLWCHNINCLNKSTHTTSGHNILYECNQQYNINCPICNKNIFIEKKILIYANITCLICLKELNEIYLTNCGHGNICELCVIQLEFNCLQIKNNSESIENNHNYLNNHANHETYLNDNHNINELTNIYNINKLRKSTNINSPMKSEVLSDFSGELQNIIPTNNILDENYIKHFAILKLNNIPGKIYTLIEASINCNWYAKRDNVNSEIILLLIVVSSWCNYYASKLMELDDFVKGYTLIN